MPELPRELIIQLVQAHDAIDAWWRKNDLSGMEANGKCADAMNALCELVLDDDVGDAKFVGEIANWNCLVAKR